MFGLLLDETIGYIPYLCGMLGFPDATFFRNASTAMGTIIAMTVWKKNFGYTMSILVVGIQGVSQSYYEAARIDGASKVQQFLLYHSAGNSAQPGLLHHHQPDRRPAGI